MSLLNRVLGRAKPVDHSQHYAEKLLRIQEQQAAWEQLRREKRREPTRPMTAGELQAELDRRAWSSGYYEIPAASCPVRIDRPVTIRDVTIIGQHRSPVAFPVTPTFEIAAGLDDTPFTYRGSGGGFRGCSFVDLGQTDPKNLRRRPAVVVAEKHPHTQMINVRDCTFIGCYHMIDVQSGRFNLEHVYGQVLNIGIKISSSWDLGRINNIHFWPFWKIDALSYWPAHNLQYPDNSRAVVLDHVDWPQMVNLFLFGSLIAIQMRRPADGTPGADPQIVNLAADACGVALDVYSTGEGGVQVTNFRAAGNQSWGSQRAIGIHSPRGADIRGAVQVTNMHHHGAVASESSWPHPGRLLQIINKHWRR